MSWLVARPGPTDAVVAPRGAVASHGGRDWSDGRLCRDRLSRGRYLLAADRSASSALGGERACANCSMSTASVARASRVCDVRRSRRGVWEVARQSLGTAFTRFAETPLVY